MGIVGFLSFLALIIAITLRTWRALQNRRTAFDAGAWWCAGWVILVCACFGVVLEGPMGAVVFWTILGVANARMHDVPETPPEREFESAPDPNLQRAGTAREV